MSDGLGGGGLGGDGGDGPAVGCGAGPETGAPWTAFTDPTMSGVA